MPRYRITLERPRIEFAEIAVEADDVPAAIVAAREGFLDVCELAEAGDGEQPTAIEIWTDGLAPDGPGWRTLAVADLENDPSDPA